MRLARWIGIFAAIGYLGLVAVFEAARRAGGGPQVADMASSPSGVLAGHAWRLLTSAFIVAGEPVAQLALTTVAVVAVLVLFGPGLFWRAAFAGHIVATVIAYLGVAVVWLVARGDVDHVVDEPDYGISCVLAGTLGALTGAGLRSWKPWPVLVAAATAVLILALVAPISDDLAGAEHGLAFVFGVVVGLRTSGVALAAPSRA